VADSTRRRAGKRAGAVSIATARSRLRKVSGFQDCDQWAASGSCDTSATEDSVKTIQYSTGYPIYDQMLVRFGTLYDPKYKQRVCGCKETYMRFGEISRVRGCPPNSNIGNKFCLMGGRTYSKVLGCMEKKDRQFVTCDNTPTITFRFN